MNDEPSPFFPLAELEYLCLNFPSALYVLFWEVWVKVYQYKRQSDKPVSFWTVEWKSNWRAGMVTSRLSSTGKSGQCRKTSGGNISLSPHTSRHIYPLPVHLSCLVKYNWEGIRFIIIQPARIPLPWTILNTAASHREAMGIRCSLPSVQYRYGN